MFLLVPAYQVVPDNGPLNSSSNSSSSSTALHTTLKTHSDGWFI